MVAESMTLNELATALENEQQLYLPGCGPSPRLEIFLELPPGTIDVPSASKEHGVSRFTIRQWVRSGKLVEVGRLKARSPGGGYIIVNEQPLKQLIKAHKKRKSKK